MDVRREEIAAITEEIARLDSNAARLRGEIGRLTRPVLHQRQTLAGASMSDAQMESIEPWRSSPVLLYASCLQGAFQSKDGRPASGTQGRIGHWRLDASNAAAVIAARRNGEQDFVIDYEHQTLNKATNGQPAPAAGWFKGLEWREGKGCSWCRSNGRNAPAPMISGR